MLEDVAAHFTGTGKDQASNSVFSSPQLALKALRGLGLIWEIVWSGGKITGKPCKAGMLNFDGFNGIFVEFFLTCLVQGTYI